MKIRNLKKTGIIVLAILFCSLVFGKCLKCISPSKAKAFDSNSYLSDEQAEYLIGVDPILEKLNASTTALKYYQCDIDYLVRQPLFESSTLRKGKLYYRNLPGISDMRVNFDSIQQDEEKPQKHLEQYFLDGFWLTHIDYQLKQAKKYQVSRSDDPNRPTNAFELLSKNFPIIGFSKTEDLKKDFFITRVMLEGAENDKFIKLLLKVKPDSIYKDNYTSIDFWIDKKLYLPAKIVTATTEEDIRELTFIKPIVNKKIDNKVFDFKVPKDFGIEIVPLKKKPTGKK